MFTVVQTLRIL